MTDTHSLLLYSSIAANESFNRQCIEYFISNDNAADRIRRGPHPGHKVRKVSQVLVNVLFLPLAKVGRHLEDSISGWQRMEFSQAREYIDRKLARASPVFKDLTTINLREDLSALARDDVAENRRHFRGGDEITPFTELCRTGCVIPQPLCIQSVLHKLRETDITPSFTDTLTNERRNALAVRSTVSIGFWQRWRQIVLHVNMMG